MCASLSPAGDGKGGGGSSTEAAGHARLRARTPTPTQQSQPGLGHDACILREGQWNERAGDEHTCLESRRRVARGMSAAGPGPGLPALSVQEGEGGRLKAASRRAKRGQRQQRTGGPSRDTMKAHTKKGWRVWVFCQTAAKPCQHTTPPNNHHHTLPARQPRARAPCCCCCSTAGILHPHHTACLCPLATSPPKMPMSHQKCAAATPVQMGRAGANNTAMCGATFLGGAVHKSVRVTTGPGCCPLFGSLPDHRQQTRSVQRSSSCCRAPRPLPVGAGSTLVRLWLLLLTVAVQA